jgi:hypothetical protein
MSGYSNPQQNSTTAIVSLIAGIAGWSIFPFFGSIIAVITGHMAKREIRESMGSIGGEGMATIGLVLGYAGIVVGLLGICCLILTMVLGVTIPFCAIGANEFGFLLAPFLGY